MKSGLTDIYRSYFSSVRNHSFLQQNNTYTPLQLPFEVAYDINVIFLSYCVKLLISEGFFTKVFLLTPF